MYYSILKYMICYIKRLQSSLTKISWAVHFQQPLCTRYPSGQFQSQTISPKYGTLQGHAGFTAINFPIFWRAKWTNLFPLTLHISATHLHLQRSSQLHTNCPGLMLAAPVLLTSLSGGNLRDISVLRRVSLACVQAFQNLPEGLSATWFTAVAPQLLKSVCPNTSPPPPSFLSCSKRVFSTVNVLLSKGNPNCFYARLHCWVLFQLQGSILHDLYPISSSTGSFFSALIDPYIKPRQSNAGSLADPSIPRSPWLKKPCRDKMPLQVLARGRAPPSSQGNSTRLRQGLLRRPSGLPPRCKSCKPADLL